MFVHPAGRQVGARPKKRQNGALATSRKSEKQLAIVIGIGDYSSDFAALDNASLDASAIAELLERDYHFQLWPDGEPLLNAAASQDAIRAAVESSLDRSSGVTRWFFYFAGHGSVVNQQGYLIPADAGPGDPGAYFPLRWLLDRCLDSECPETLIVLDACYSGRALVQTDELSDLIPNAGDVDRVRQLIASGNPDQPVLDGGGSGHSIFTQAFLEALAGFAGVHNKDGLIRFTPLFDYLALEIPTRLGTLGLSPDRQQPIGGNLAGNRLRREYILKPIVARLPPATILGIHSDDPGRRLDSLKQLTEDCRAQPARRPAAIQLARRYLQTRPDESYTGLGFIKPQFEPVDGVRAQAARTLGELGDRSATQWLIQALDDVSVVRRAAAHALGSLADPLAIPAMLTHLRTSEADLFLDFVGAIGAIADVDAITEVLKVSIQRGRLVPFIGPDLPQDLTGVPDRASISGNLSRQENLPRRNSLAQVASASMQAGSRFVFTNFLREKFNDPRLQPGDFHRSLTKLSAPLWINAGYDTLLAAVLGADTIVDGNDTRYFRPGRPTVVQLAGETTKPDSLLVLEDDYQRLRPDGGQPQMLIDFLHQQLTGKVILFLGCDPASPDFWLTHQYVLNQHLRGIRAQAFLVWQDECPALDWSGQRILHIARPPQEFIPLLVQS